MIRKELDRGSRGYHSNNQVIVSHDTSRTMHGMCFIGDILVVALALKMSCILIRQGGMVLPDKLLRQSPTLIEELDTLRKREMK